ncbi:MAG: hypothetical protein PHU12_01315, partial [Candidatus Aenigmarchaeota archaeon]|nr:hypothetical protein [Candidatus Aenigmarchaeota archaeon]
TLKYDINLPQSLEPGTHDTRIGIVETSGPEGNAGATIGAIAGVEMQLWIKVPYPGYYIAATLNVPDIGVGESTPITLEVNNLGQNNINSLTATVNIYDSENNIVGTTQTDTISMITKKTETFLLNWDSQNMDAGIYKAIAEINYDGNTKSTETTFTIGELIVKINDIRLNDIPVGSIGKAEIDIENMYTKEVKNVWAELQILKDGNKVGTFNSGSIDLQSKGTGTITGYIDTEGISAGAYTLKVILHYEDKKSEKTKEFNIGNSGKNNAVSSENNSFMWILLIIILITIVFVIYRAKRNSV